MTLLVPGSLLWRVFPVAGVLEPAGPSLDLGFLNTTLDSRITFSRASSATSGVFTDAAGSAYTSYATNVARMTSSGFLIEESRTNSLLNSDTPATQTTASLAAGTYTLWVIGTGSATSSAGTAVGSGFGAATAGTPNSFTLTVGGTVVVTKAGTLTRFQLENGAFATSYIPTTAAAVTRALDQCSITTGNWFNPNAGSLQIEYTTGRTDGSFGVNGGLSDGTFNNSVYQNGTNFNAIISGVGVSATSSAPGSGTTINKVAGSYQTLLLRGEINNGTVGSAVTGSAPFPWTLRLSIGCSPWALDSQTDGYIRRVRYWPRALANAELQQVTT